MNESENQFHCVYSRRHDIIFRHDILIQPVVPTLFKNQIRYRKTEMRVEKQGGTESDRRGKAFGCAGNRVQQVKFKEKCDAVFPRK